MLDEVVFQQLKVTSDNLGSDEPFTANGHPAMRPQLIASTTLYTPTANDSISSTTSGPPARRHVINGKPFIKAVDMELAEDQISIVPFMRNNKISIGANMNTRTISSGPASAAPIKDKSRNLVTHTMQLRRLDHNDTNQVGSNIISGRVSADSRAKTMKETANNVYRKKQSSLVSWLGRPWALSILTLSIVGALCTLYTFTFLLMKACEGALGRTNQALALFHLFAIIAILVAAVL